MSKSSISQLENPTNTPVEEVKNPLLEQQKVKLFVKRDDLLHRHMSGNKWRKLKYNLLKAKKQEHGTLLTFGGAFSNHIAAVAAAGHKFGFKTIGIIRGEEHFPLNPTLKFAQEQGMQFKYISRTQYKEKDSPDFLIQLKEMFGRFYLLPEGGTNELAVKGCAEIIEEIDAASYDFICAPCGTGGTLAGLITGLNHRRQILGFPVLKGGSFLKKEIDDLTESYNGKVYHNFQLMTDYHFGGYAKWNDELLNFMRIFRDTTGITLDPIYTGKMFYGLNDLIRKQFFLPGRRILAIHTGGLQGIKGFNERHGELL